MPNLAITVPGSADKVDVYKGLKAEPWRQQAGNPHWPGALPRPGTPDASVTPSGGTATLSLTANEPVLAFVYAGAALLSVQQVQVGGTWGRPQLGSITPTTAVRNTSTTITANGLGYTTSMQIVFNGVKVPTKFISGYQLQATVTTPNAAGTSTVQVTNNSGHTTSVENLTVT